ncbi:hypothetical protein [Devosia sp. XK-2]|uniref:hypothetical protein n=1 Tax=Devosia sp. XK-2 TaxID=3126689 RepID=UPI0030D18EC9
MSGHAEAVVALAGRRIDAKDDAEPHFPLELVGQVEREIARAFSQLAPNYLVCSAACGVDLIALKVARQSGILFHIVLPFDRAKFKKTSVEDRPGNWSGLYEDLISEASKSGRLIELVGVGEGDAAYSAATAQIIETARLLAGGSSNVTAVAVTDTNPRTGHDATAELLALAARAGFAERTIEIPQGP